MANNSTAKALATQISADKKRANENHRALDKVRLNYQCKCAHRDMNGAFALNPPQGNKPKQNPFTGKALYRCRICEKELDISQIVQEDYQRALDTIDRILDIGKMHMDLNTERDRELLTLVAKMQYQLQSTIPDLYKAICNGNKRKKRPNNLMSGMVSVGR